MKPLPLREADFKREIEPYLYPKEMKEAFFNYWSEPNKSGTKMKFEMEKTWHLGRRLARWANNGFGQGKKETPVISPKMPVKAPETEIEKLDDMLKRYQSRFESVSTEEMASWYEYLKREKLMRIFTHSDIELIKASYPNDRIKCRAACVKMTLDGYINTGLTFSHIMNLRARLV